MNFWTNRWVHMLVGIFGGVAFALYRGFEPFSWQLMLGIGMFTPLILIMAFGFSALSKEGYRSLSNGSIGQFLAAGVPIGVILGSFL